MTRMVRGAWVLMASLILGLVSVRFALGAVDEHADSHGDSGGLPQLDFTTWPTQIFWLVVSFGLAYILMWRVALPRIGSVLEERHNRIQGDLKRAKAASENAEQARQAFEVMLAESREKASAVMREATESIRNKMERKIKTSNASTAEKMAEAEKDIAEAKARAMIDVVDIASTSAAEAVAQLTNIKISQADATKQVKQISDTKGEQNG